MLKLPELFYWRCIWSFTSSQGYSTSTYLSLYAVILLPRVSPLSPKALHRTQLCGWWQSNDFFQSCWISASTDGASSTRQHSSVFKNLSAVLDWVQGWHSRRNWPAAVALLPVIFGYVVCQPVHFGFPALSQGFIELQPEVLQCLLIRFPKSEGILKGRGRNQCSLTERATEPLTAQLIRGLRTKTLLHWKEHWVTNEWP